MEKNHVYSNCEIMTNNLEQVAYIKRIGYLEKITPFIDKNLIKVLVGQRRVGKSYLLMQIKDVILAKRPNANFIYINKEQYEFDDIRSYKELIKFVESKKKKNKYNYLFIDEIQDIDEFERALRHFALDNKMDIYCTGSNANLLSGELATFLSGRYVEFKVFGLAYLEFLNFHELKNNSESLKKYILWGGLPFIKNLQKRDEVIAEYLKNIYSTIIYKDIISRFQIRNTNFLENLVRFLANNVGSIISAKKISDYLKSQKINMSPQIVLNYLDHLMQAFLIFNVKRMDVGGKKIFEINEKFYFEDWGIMNSIIGFANIDIGKIIENIVFIHLKINGFEVTVGKSGEKEIDFVCIKNGKKIYIQACYLISDEKVKKREFGNLLEIKDNYTKMVVSMDEYAPTNVKGILHIPLREFLSNPI
ncbi:ATP-binding protein [soil metagenome]